MENFDISRFFKVLFNCKLYICFILLLFLTIGYFYSFYYVTPMYKSSATIVLVQNDGMNSNDNVASITQSDITLNQNLLSTYTKIAKSDKVLEQVISNLNLNISTKQLYNLISVQAISNTEVFKISVSNKDNVLASNITNELLSVFSNEVKSLYNMNNVYPMDMAEPDTVPYNIDHIKDLIVFSVIGVVVSLGLVIIVYLLDNTIKSEQDIEDYANIAVLSTIPVYQSKQNKNFNELIVNEQPKSPIAECFKTFRTNIMFSIQNKKLNTILITSGSMSEGKSFVSSNLAVTFAQSGKKVILVDTDMRKGRIHKIFNISNKPGLSNCLSNIGADGSDVNINEYIQKTSINNLHVMTSGDVPPNPSELLSSPNMKAFLEALNTQYDVVICDGTPCMLVSDSIILSKIVDTTVIVTTNKVTKLDTLLKIKKSIEIVGGNIGGAVINKMTISNKSYQSKYYYGNHNEISDNLDINITSSDSILDDVLCIKNSICLDDNELVEYSNNILNNNVISDNINIDKLSNIINDNTTELLELKGLYKNVMQNTLDVINNLDIINELDSMKRTYEDKFSLQNSQIASLDSKLSNFIVEDNSSTILEELRTIKENYENSIVSQSEKINKLNDRISNINFDEQAYVILDELNNIRSSYEDAISAQNNYIATLDDKISNFKVEDNSSIILDELHTIKEDYEDRVVSQNEEINKLNDKISNINFDEQSYAILDELNNIRSSYEDAINTQNNYIATLNDKISNFKVEDNSNIILEQLDSVKTSNENAIEVQNEEIKNLKMQIANMKTNDNSEILYAIESINKQLEIINNKFDLLENKAQNNERLIKNISKSNTDNYRKPNYIDVKKLDEKIVSIQDYLEKGYDTNFNGASSKSKNKNKLDGQISIIDNLLENTNQSDSNNKNNSSVIDYTKFKKKQKKGLSIFKFNHNNHEYEEEEEVNIVSQILCENSNTSVG